MSEAHAASIKIAAATVAPKAHPRLAVPDLGMVGSYL